MATPRSDALVLFGVTGDLAHKMIFTALYAMAKRGTLKVPVVGVAFPNWSLARLRQRVKDGIKRSGEIDDPRALHHLLSSLRYVSGDYKEPGTFTEIKPVPGGRRTTSPFHPRSSRPSSRDSAARGWRTMRASSSRSHSGATWPPHGSSTASRSRCSRKARSSASTTSWGRRRS
jgi:glucose-6-phosphate 1-dehydrogenase